MSRWLGRILLPVSLVLLLLASSCAAPAAAPTPVPPPPTKAPAAPAATVATAAPAATAAPTTAAPAAATKPAVTTPAAAATAAPTKPAAAATAAPKPFVRGKEIIVAINTFAQDVLDPMLMTASSGRNLLEPMLDSFIRVDFEGNLIPGVFTKWTPSADGKYWDFEVRKGVKFHGNNGEATAEDCKFSLERMLEADAVYRQNWAKEYDRSEVVNPYLLRLYTKGPRPFLPIDISQYSANSAHYLMPKKYIEEKGIQVYRQQPIGSGPYQFKSRVQGSSIEYAAFPDHWGTQPGYDTLKVIFVPQENARIGLLRSGGAQVIEITPDGAKDVKAAGLNVLSSPASIQANFLIYGSLFETWKGKPTSDVRVRKAMALAINRKEIIDSMLTGSVLPSAAGITGSTLEIDRAKWTRVANEAYRYDFAEAKKLMTDAGLANGFETTLFSYELSGVPQPMLCQAVAGYWDKLGIKSKIVDTDLGAFQPLRNADPPPASILGQVSAHRWPDRPDLPAVMDSFYYADKGQWRLLNKSVGTNFFPDLDKLILASESEFDVKKREQMNDQVLTITVPLYTVIPIADVPAVFGADTKVDLDVKPFSQIGARIVFAKPKS